MNFIQATILGIIQGLTEFLPVSSSGHLVLFQNLFGLTEPELLFDICVHVGTLLAVCIIFFDQIRSILNILLTLPGRIRSPGGMKRLYDENEAFRIAVLIVFGSMPTALLGVLFKRIAEQLFSGIWIVGCMLLVTATLLWLTRRTRETGRPLNRMTIKDALVIGTVQGLAILPGISRSGSTISVALFLGVDREVAGRFSFLLSIPAILGALLISFDSSVMNTSTSFGTIFMGTAAATVVGYAALKILLKLVKKGQLYRFAPYCWAVGAIALIWSMV